jgi:glutamate synthase domain-containing protein 2
MDDSAQLDELLAQLVGKLRPNDAIDPVIAGLLSQLIAILDPEASPLPQQMVDELSHIDERVDRFKQAAMKLGSLDPNKLKELADSMKMSGLLKSEKAWES